MVTLTVDPSGKGHYCSIQEALDAVPYEQETTIIIEEGVYHEKLFSDKRSLHLIGRKEVIITHSDGAKQKIDAMPKRGTFRSYTAFFSGEFLKMEHIIIENRAGKGSEAGQGIALYLDVDCAHLSKVRLLGSQDTLFVAPLPVKEREPNGFYGPRCFAKRKQNALFFDHGFIQGGVDLIFGGGDALFRNSVINSCEAGFVTAPSTGEKNIGLVFDHCSFTANDGVEPCSVYVMRPWREHGKALFLSCTFGLHIHPSLRIDWPGHEGLSEGFLGCHRCRFSDERSTDASYELSNAQAISLLDAVEQRCQIFHQSTYGNV